MSEYLSILGREPELAVAELEAVFLPHSRVTVISPQAVLLETTKDLSGRFIDRLGGTVKISEVVTRLPGTKGALQKTTEWLTAERLIKLMPENGRDVGFSIYGVSAAERGRFRGLGLELKKQLREHGRAIRIVTSREPQLSAVTVQRQGLIKHGIEILVIQGETEVVMAKTLAVQDYQAYSLRDYGRPEKDAKRGMIPPKLAQMMLNLARLQPDDIVLDPFCGVGTILQEAVLMGAREVHGSDLDALAVKKAQANIRWLLKEYPELKTTVEITKCEARENKFRADAVVTEPDLGQPLRGHEPSTWLMREARRLEELYLATFNNWTRTLASGARVVMIWPVFHSGASTIALELDKRVENMGFIRQSLLSAISAQALRVTDVRVLEYAREDARVRRQVRMWVKK